MMLPVTNGGLANWDNLNTALKEADKSRESVYCDGKMIVAFDLQLYIKAIQLQEKVDIESDFVFRMILKVTLSFEWERSNGSGSSQAFE